MDRTAFSAGWIALIHEIDDGHWLDPTEATAITGVHAPTLRAWAEQGVISRIHQPGHHYRYLGEELVVVVGLARGGTPTLRRLRRYINDQLQEIRTSS